MKGSEVVSSEDMAMMSACSRRAASRKACGADVGAQIDHLEAVDLEHQRHHVLADVVDVALRGADDHRARGRAVAARMRGWPVRAPLACMALTTTPARIRSGRNTSSRLKASPIDLQDRLDDVPEEFERCDALGERVLRPARPRRPRPAPSIAARSCACISPHWVSDWFMIWSPAEVLRKSPAKGRSRGVGCPQE